MSVGSAALYVAIGCACLDSEVTPWLGVRVGPARLQRTAAAMASDEAPEDSAGCPDEGAEASAKDAQVIFEMMLLHFAPRELALCKEAAFPLNILLEIGTENCSTPIAGDIKKHKKLLLLLLAKFTDQVQLQHHDQW